MAGQPGGIVQPGGPAPAPPPEPTLVLSRSVVLVRKSHTEPSRAELTVGTSMANFPNGGVLTRSGPEIELFDTAAGGQAVQFTGQNTLVLTAADLNGNRRFFVQGATPSGQVDGSSLSLALVAGGTAPQVGNPVTVSLTSVRLTLNVGGQRPDPATAPPLLDQPPAAPGPNPTDKWHGGRVVSAQDGQRSQERAQLLVQQAEPVDFALPLVLRQVAVAGNAIGAPAARLRLFDREVPAGGGEAPFPNPRVVPTALIPQTGLEVWAEGRTLSAARRDVGFQLGVQNVDFDGDRVAFTVGVGGRIALASPAVLVRKPHTSPERHAVRLRLGAPFGRGGVLRRSSDSIRLFDRASGGNEIAFNNDEAAVAAADLTRGLDLFAQGERASTALDDFRLTLTLDPGAGAVPFAGAPARARLTAVEVFLNVGLSRPSAGAAPPDMPQPPAAPPPAGTAADKWFRGRHVGLQSTRVAQERARVLAGAVQPPDFAGDLELRQVRLQNLAIVGASNRARLFDDEAPTAGEAARPNPLSFPAADTRPNGRELWLEGAAVSGAGRDVGFQLGVRNLGRDGDRISATVVQIEIARQASASPAVATDTVRVGLWEDAFDPATGNLRNGQAAVDSFIDRDPRRFHLRVRDASAAGQVTVQWKTTVRDNAGVEADDDNPATVPFSADLTLTETAANSHVFVSRGVMLTTDTTDQNQGTDSGLPAAHPDAGLRQSGDSNHRMRLITVDDTHPLDSFVVAEYRAAAGLNPTTARADVFDRAPEERRRVRVHLIDVRETPGVAGSGPLGFVHEFNATNAILSIYATCGIFAEIDKVEIDPPASCIGWTALYPTDLLAANPSVENTASTANPSTSQNDLVNAVRALPTFDANDLYVVYVRRIYATPLPPPPGPGLVDSAGGIAFPDVITPATSARSFAFIALDSGITEFADPHEITHLTTNIHNAAAGHFDLGAAAAVAPGNIDGKNLMNRFALVANLGIANPRRLWNRTFNNTARVPNLFNPSQIGRIRRPGHRFLRPY